MVGDDITVELIRDRLAQSNAKNGFILDGFPRTINQAEQLEKIAKIDCAVNFDINDEAVVERLSGRRVCRKCSHNFHVVFMPPEKENTCTHCGGELYIRDDDKPEAIKRRLEVYRAQTAPLIDFYRSKNLLKNIDAKPATDIILADFKKNFPL